MVFKNRIYNIIEARQRIAFLINERGSKVESEAEIVAVAAAAAPPSPDEVIVKRPKKLIFDKPYTLMLRRANELHPYLLVKVHNTELMERR